MRVFFFGEGNGLEVVIASDEARAREFLSYRSATLQSVRDLTEGHIASIEVQEEFDGWPDAGFTGTLVIH